MAVYCRRDWSLQQQQPPRRATDHRRGGRDSPPGREFTRPVISLSSRAR